MQCISFAIVGLAIICAPCFFFCVCGDVLRWNDFFYVEFEKPSAIQQRAIVPIIKGRDVIAQAQSGTGKTATLSIGTLQSIDTTNRNVQALILSPTRELAQQIAKVIMVLGRYLSIQVFFFLLTHSKKEAYIFFWLSSGGNDLCRRIAGFLWMTCLRCLSGACLCGWKICRRRHQKAGIWRPRRIRNTRTCLRYDSAAQALHSEREAPDFG